MRFLLNCVIAFESHNAQTELVRYLIFKKNNILPAYGNSASRTEQASVRGFSNSASICAVAKSMLESSLSYPSIAFSPHCGCSYVSQLYVGFWSLNPFVGRGSEGRDRADWLVADSWCWFSMKEQYCWLVGWQTKRTSEDGRQMQTKHDKLYPRRI